MSRHRLAYTPCASCGSMIETGRARYHACDSERLVEYRLGALRPGIARFERDFQAWLSSVSGAA
jgi:hypothetical protein